MFTTTYQTINFVKTPVSIEAKGFELDLTITHNKSSKLKMLSKLTKKHGEKFARFYSIKGTCPCCMREFNVNKITGKLSHHYTKGTTVKCSGAGMEPLEISDQGLVQTIKEYIQLVDTYKMLARKSHQWSNARKEYTAQAQIVKDVLAQKVDLLITYRDLESIKRKEEAERAKKEAAKKLKEERQSEKAKVRFEYYDNRCEGTHCPRCGKTAESRDEVEELFGFRKKKIKGITVPMPQSYCKVCRSIQNKEYRLKKLAQKEQKAS
tara:strand:+ start:914 stop:1708 length:795 start_codon:yes stop_codon:yes gene_type:complete